MARKTPPQLAVVPLRPAADPPPCPLGEAGMRLWSTVMAEYGIHDAGGREILRQACHAADRAEELAAAIAEDGVMVRTRTGMRDHPALKHETANRALVSRLLSRLGLDVEAIKPVGRPPGQLGG